MISWKINLFTYITIQLDQTASGVIEIAKEKRRVKFRVERGCLCGLAVPCWTRDHYHPCSNLGVGIYEGCFIFDFASLPLEVVEIV